MITPTRTPTDLPFTIRRRVPGRRRSAWALAGLLLALGGAGGSRADTVASLLGNFTINQYCGLRLAQGALTVHYTVVYGQLPALRELHLADANGDGVTSQAERDAYVGRLAAGFARGLMLRLDGRNLPLHANSWTSSLPSEQGGFSLRIDVDFAGTLPPARGAAPRKLEFANGNYPGRIGWHEIVVELAAGLAAYDTNAYDTSLTGGLTEASQALPAAGPLDERSVYLTFGGSAPLQSKPIGARPNGVNGSNTTGAATAITASFGNPTRNWIERRTRVLVDAIAGPMIAPGVAILTLLGALFLVLGMGITLLVQRGRIARDALAQAAPGSVTAFRAITPTASSPRMARHPFGPVPIGHGAPPGRRRAQQDGLRDVLGVGIQRRACHYTDPGRSCVPPCTQSL